MSLDWVFLVCLEICKLPVSIFLNNFCCSLPEKPYKVFWIFWWTCFKRSLNINRLHCVWKISLDKVITKMNNMLLPHLKRKQNSLNKYSFPRSLKKMLATKIKQLMFFSSIFLSYMNKKSKEKSLFIVFRNWLCKYIQNF